MSKHIIGIGRCSKYYIYILGTILFRCLKDCIFGFMAINPKSKTGLFGFIPELSKHYFLQDFYRNISFIIGGLLFLRISKKSIEEKKYHRKSLLYKGLIHNKKKADSENIKIYKILIICAIYSFHQEASRVLYSFGFDGLDFWIFDVVFTLLFIDTYFLVQYYSHQKFSIIFIISVNSLLLLVSSFLDNNIVDKQNVYSIIEEITGNNIIFIAILASFILLSIMVSFSRVKLKILMYYNFIPPYKIIYYIGLIGTIYTLIALIISNFLVCNESMKQFCDINIINNINESYYYYENVISYFSNDLKYNEIKTYVELFLITPLCLIINFLGFTCEILTIYYLNPLYVLVRENLYYFIQRFVFLFVNLGEFEKYYTINRFIILQITEILALFGYSVYLEIIELRFCNLDKDLRRKISERGKRESIQSTIEYNNDDNDDSDDNDDEEDNNNEEDKDDK